MIPLSAAILDGLGNGATHRAGLLVSVRSVLEAEAALAGGADLIDVKEPAHGSLGRADDATIAAVLEQVAGRRPLSAALGELTSKPHPFPGNGLRYVKWGLAGGAGPFDWRRTLQEAAHRLRKVDSTCRPVAVAYADWRRAEAPSPAEVCAFACERAWAVFLLDTWRKDGTTLLDWLSLTEIAALRHQCQAAGVRVALAGSLRPAQFSVLRPLCPDWFAVRGAACRGGERGAAVEAAAVRQLTELLTPTTRDS